MRVHSLGSKKKAMIRKVRDLAAEAADLGLVKTGRELDAVMACVNREVGEHAVLDFRHIRGRDLMNEQERAKASGTLEETKGGGE